MTDKHHVPFIPTIEPEVPKVESKPHFQIVPPGFLNELGVILRDSGADTRSQQSAIDKVKELLDNYNGTHNHGVVDGGTSVNEPATANLPIIPKHSEIPGKG